MVEHNGDNGTDSDERRQEGGMFRHTDDLLQDACGIIEESQRVAYRAVNVALVQRNWLLGRRIAEEDLAGEERAEYGERAIKELAKELTKRYGKGFTKRALYQFVEFYRCFPSIVYSVSTQSVPFLSWTHYRVLLQVHAADAREWYAREAAEQGWSVRTLQRKVGSPPRCGTNGHVRAYVR